jgi:hypothetical protein
MIFAIKGKRLKKVWFPTKRNGFLLNKKRNGKQSGA